MLTLNSLVASMPILGDYVYIGGGILTLIVIVLIVLFVMRR
jgi:hypothetical protein